MPTNRSSLIYHATTWKREGHRSSRGQTTHSTLALRLYRTGGTNFNAHALMRLCCKKNTEEYSPFVDAVSDKRPDDE